MYRKLKTRFFTVTMFGFIIAVIIFTPGISLHAGSVPSRSNGPSVTNVGERPVHPGYPEIFDFIGRVDRIANGEAVISDSLYRVSSSASYHAPGPSNALRSRFRAGDRVGCLINADDEIESIWLISRKGR